METVNENRGIPNFSLADAVSTGLAFSALPKHAKSKNYFLLKLNYRLFSILCQVTFSTSYNLMQLI